MALSSQATRVERIAHAGVRTVTALVLFFLVAPILVIIPLSFTSSELLVYPVPDWSLRWYEKFFTDERWMRATWNSVFVAVATTLLATLLGTVAAFGLHQSRSRAKPLVLGLLVCPLVIPLVIMAVAVFYYLALWGLVGSYVGLIVAHTVLAMPFVVITVLATLQGLDMNMLRAASSLGAPPHLAFRKVAVPLVSPGVISGALFAFIISFDEVVIALFLTSPATRTLPRQIFSGVSENISPTITAAAVVLVLVSLALMGLVELLRRRGERLRGERLTAGANRTEEIPGESQ